MRILADENIPGDVVRALRKRGHDVRSVKESLRAASDLALLSVAKTEHRVLVTQDKDFGELAFRFRLPATAGVLLFRLEGMPRDESITLMLRAIESRADWTGEFAVVKRERIRVRSLPDDSPITS